jgi:hypothetical protein
LIVSGHAAIASMIERATTTTVSTAMMIVSAVM